MAVQIAEVYSYTATQEDAITIAALNAADESAWDKFVCLHKESSPFHLIAWKKTIQESFGFQPYYFMARNADGICAVLPLFYIRNPLIGKVLMSTPFAVYGGILAMCDKSRRLLYEHVNSLARQMGCDYVEYRNRHHSQCVGVPNISRYVAFSQRLTPDETTLLESLPKKTRNMVRKALRTPFQMRVGVCDTYLLDHIHSRNMQRLGTPNFPRRYFDRLLANFGSMADIREVWLDDKVMAVSLNLYYGKDMHTYHAAADKQSNTLGPNTFMYYDHLRWSGQNGFETFDFGRCKRNTGVFEFKKHWNTEMRELPYEIVLINRKELPNFSPANPKFDLPIRIWRKLPLPLTRAVSRFVFPLFP